MSYVCKVSIKILRIKNI
jgi:hypothetical protein